MEDKEKLFKWETRHSTFSNFIRSLRYKGTYTDVTLACDGKLYPLHKFVLAICSDYFSKILESIECSNPVIILTGIHCSDMELLIDYIYTGEVIVREDKIPSFLKAAQSLRINCLDFQKEEPKSCSSITEKQSPLLKAKMTGENRSTNHIPKIDCTSPTQGSKISTGQGEKYLIPENNFKNTEGVEDIATSDEVEDISGHNLTADISDPLDIKIEDDPLSISDYDCRDVPCTSSDRDNSKITESLPDAVAETNSHPLKRKRTSEERHRPKKFGTKDNGTSYFRRCHVCYNPVNPADKKIVRTKYGCLECDKPLCIDPCWTIYHFEKIACKCCA